MADAPAPPKGGSSPLQMITRKVGPLPVWAYAAVLVLGYYLYRRSHPSQSTPQTTAGGPAESDQAYVPPFDAAGASGGGGIGSVGTPGVVNNYYYGDQAAQQAQGGGTAATGVGNPTGPGGVMTPGGGSTGTPIGIGAFGPGGGGVRYPIVQPVSTPSTSLASVQAYVPAHTSGGRATIQPFQAV